MHWLAEMQLKDDGLDQAVSQAQILASQLRLDVPTAFSIVSKGGYPCDPIWEELHSLWVVTQRFKASAP